MAGITRADAARHPKADAIETLALPLSTLTEPTATAPTDVEPVHIMAALLSGFLADKCCGFQ